MSDLLDTSIVNKYYPLNNDNSYAQLSNYLEELTITINEQVF